MPPQQNNPTARYKPIGNNRLIWKTRAPEVRISGPAGTGKTRAALEFALWQAYHYPQSRILLCRRFRSELTQSTLTIFEKEVLPRGHYAARGASRSVRQSYELSNGSEIVVGGLDNSERILSAQYDLIIIDEATYVELQDYENIITRLRNHVIPWQQVLCLCNPSYPSHWLNTREMYKIETTHADNPACTPEYLAILNKLTGVQRSRLLLGLWVAAEGLIFPSMSESVVDYGRPTDGQRIGSVDFGWNDPHACLAAMKYEVDGQFHYYIYWERKKSQIPLEQHAEAMKIAAPDTTWYADPSRPDSIRELQKLGLRVRPARNDILYGIDVVNTLIESKRLHISKECKDLILDSQKYQWKPDAKGEKPLPGDDHLMDCIRYLCASTYQDQKLVNPQVVGFKKYR